MTNYNVTGGLNDNTVYHVSVTASNNAGSSSSATTSIRTNSNGKLCINNYVYPYGGKLWRVETLADLANHHKFAKVSSAKILVQYILPTCFCNEFSKVCTHQE